MKLLLSLFDPPVKSLNKKGKRGSSLLLVDTDLKKHAFVNTPVIAEDTIGVTGMAYSGNWLCCNLFLTFINNKSSNISSYLYLINLITGFNCLYDLKISHYSHDIISVYPGKVYINCISTDSMIGVSFSPITGLLLSEELHFSLPAGGYGVFGFNSMCNYMHRWFGSLIYDNNSYNGEVIELSTQRVIYSNLNKPNSVFFNSAHRLCFCEGGAGKIHIGDSIFFVGGYPQGIIEDQDKGGYWVVSHFLPHTNLLFISYTGEIDYKNILSLDYFNVFKIIEVKGKWLNQYFQ